MRCAFFCAIRNGAAMTPRVLVAWSMPSRWTFSMPPVREFLDRWLAGAQVIVDPFCGESTIGTLRNDLGRPSRNGNEQSHIDPTE